MTRKSEIDVQFSNHGSIWLASPLTTAAREWIDENISDESQWFGGALAIEPRYGEDIVTGMREAGLIVEG